MKNRKSIARTTTKKSVSKTTGLYCPKCKKNLLRIGVTNIQICVNWYDVTFRTGKGLVQADYETSEKQGGEMNRYNCNHCGEDIRVWLETIENVKF